MKMLSCPFCGCDDLETSPWPGDRDASFYVCRCGNSDCNAEITAGTAELAAERWNRTAPTRGPAFDYRDSAQPNGDRNE